MENPNVKAITSGIGKLSAGELATVKKALARRESTVESDLVEMEMAESVKECPHCGHKALKNAGSKGGRKRFRCLNPEIDADGTKTCGKTFNGFTGTPLAGLHNTDRFLMNARGMVAGNTVRAMAKELKCAVSTAFRWRHRFLESVQQKQPKTLQGVVEADETFFLESFKGQRKLPKGRAPKKRGTPAKLRGLSKEQIPVLVARDRTNSAMVSAVLPSRKGKDISAVLSHKLTRDVVLITDGATAYRQVARDRGVEVRTVPANPKKKAPGPNHIINVNNYDKRLKGWMDRFNGVATKYLHNYVGWHRWLDASKGNGKARKFFADAAKTKDKKLHKHIKCIIV